MTRPAVPHQRILAPSGDTLVVLPLEAFEDMVDELAAAQAARDGGETLSLDDMRALLDAPTPLRFWRTKRGMTEDAVSAAAGISSALLSELESGQAEGGVRVMRALADALAVSLDDLVPGGDVATDPAG